MFIAGRILDILPEMTGENVPEKKHNNIIEKGGWDKMPGQENADYAVARACADGLELLIKK